MSYYQNPSTPSRERRNAVDWGTPTPIRDAGAGPVRIRRNAVDWDGPTAARHSEQPARPQRRVHSSGALLFGTPDPALLGPSRAEPMHFGTPDPALLGPSKPRARAGASAAHHTVHHGRAHQHAPQLPRMIAMPRIPELDAAQARGLPPLPSLPVDAPSKDQDHPYFALRLARAGSGNYDPAPAQKECAECICDTHLAYTQMKAPGTAVVSTSGVWRGQGIKKEHNIPITLVFQPTIYAGGNRRTVPLATFLEFRTHEIEHADWKVVRQNDGPLIVEFLVFGPPPASPELFRTHDVIYANCRHRKITNFQLGYWLAYAHRHLIRTKLPGYKWREFDLLCFASRDELLESFTCSSQIRATF